VTRVNHRLVPRTRHVTHRRGAYSGRGVTETRGNLLFDQLLLLLADLRLSELVAASVPVVTNVLLQEHACEVL
jgi:hypothetical protein